MKTYTIFNGKLMLCPGGFFHQKSDVDKLKKRRAKEAQGYRDIIVSLTNQLKEIEETVITLNNIIDRLQ